MAPLPDFIQTTDAASAHAEQPRVVRLKKRADFVRAAKGLRAAQPGLVLQCHPSPETADSGTRRVGFTATRKLGNAVVRNRVKRRLREAAARVLPECGRAGYDYVLIGRNGTATRPFGRLVEDLRAALKRVHRTRGDGDKRRPSGRKKRQETRKKHQER